MKKLLSLIALMALVGCASTPAPLTYAKLVPNDRLLEFQTKNSSFGTITVVRDEGYVGGGCYNSFYINGRLSARVDVGERATFYVPPGEVLLKMGRDSLGRGLCSTLQDHWTQRETIIKKDETKHFRLMVGERFDIQRLEY